MTISVTISGDNAKELHQQALRVAEFFASPLAAVKPKKNGPTAAPAPVQTDIEDHVEHVSSASVSSAAPAETSHDDMVAALSAVNSKNGMQAVRDIIGKVGAKKVNEVKPEDRAAVVATAKMVVG